MPYISKCHREKYDKLIDKLAYILNTRPNDSVLSGEMNYVLFRLARLLTSQDTGGQQNYARMAVVASALAEAQAEFRRRVMIPYEDGKIETAGDVEL